jgi:hypothetical protein
MESYTKGRMMLEVMVGALRLGMEDWKGNDG